MASGRPVVCSQTTRTPWPPSSTAHWRHWLSMASKATPVPPTWGMDRRAVVAVMVMITPAPRRAMCRAAARVVRNWARRAVATGRAKSSNGSSSRGSPWTSPWLMAVKDTSIPPASAATASAWASTAPSSRASTSAVMADPPTGTVTFLFTDIEGSTGLLQALGDRYPAVLDEHAAILRKAVADTGGVEVSTHGDAFFVVFTSPAAAVRAAVAAQLALAAHDWSPGPPVRVRMGLHTGEGTRGGDDYAGLDVHRAARIADAAHGGQVLVSGTTRALVEQTLPDGATLRDLGPHRLRGLAEPERLHQLAGGGLADEFPPPRTLDARPGNLPHQLSSFVGREAEIAEVERLLGETRLLTLTGPGGSGKSRLALAVAADLLPRFQDGAWFVDLAPVADPALVPAAVANTLGVPEAADRPILDGLKQHLRDRELLLVADNFEQVAEAGPVLEELLGAAPRVRAIVTSRMVLSLQGEQEYAVPPLPVPDPDRLPRDLAELEAMAAVRLFRERAAAASPRFVLTAANAPVVAEVCARLDGLPLAIELAATRTKVLTPEQILDRLKRRLALLTSGPRSLPKRQQTLRAAIAWSYDLLDEAERRLFARLSVFTGGWTFEAAEAVCEPEAFGLDALDGLTSLVDQSLVRRVELPGRPARFSMLETIREFGLEQLEASGELEPVRR